MSFSSAKPQPSTKKCIAIVDPISTGANIACEVKSRGWEVIAVWTGEITSEVRTHIPEVCKGFKYLAEVEEQSTLEATADKVKAAAKDYKLEACFVGGETGVTLADELSENLGLRSNGTMVGHRRNKNIQQKLVAKSGLRAVREAVGTNWSDVEAFVASEGMPMVVKPVESAGSDGVQLCYTKQEVKDHFELLMGAQRKVGAQGAAVLCQEFLKGKEYVVDHVSHDGVHKTLQMWSYDKRACNGAAFVYYGMLPVKSGSKEAKILVPYVRGVLDALKIKHGPTHGEVMMGEDDVPCLVEMNCRAHGGDGAWMPLAKGLNGGRTQVTATVDCFLDEAAWKKVPDVPPSPFKAFGEEVDIVNMRAGVIVGTPGYDKIRKFPSYVSIEGPMAIGDSVEPTVDMFTMVGAVILLHNDAQVLAKDVAKIRQMELDMAIFDFEEHAVLLGPRPDSRSRSNSDVDIFHRGRSRSDGAMSHKSGRSRAGTYLETVKEEGSYRDLATPLVIFASGVLVGLILARKR